MERYGTVGQVADDNIMRRMRFASWITKATDTHSEYATLLLFHSNKGYTNPPNVTLYVHCRSRCQSPYYLAQGHVVAQLVKALCYKSEGRGFDSR